MPTINQLVRKPRQSKITKSKSPALNKGYNSFKKSALFILLPPQKMSLPDLRIRSIGLAEVFVCRDL